jgi:hypothetical protein
MTSTAAPLVHLRVNRQVTWCGSRRRSITTVNDPAHVTCEECLAAYRAAPPEERTTGRGRRGVRGPGAPSTLVRWSHAEWPWIEAQAKGEGITVPEFVRRRALAGR